MCVDGGRVFTPNSKGISHSKDVWGRNMSKQCGLQATGNDVSEFSKKQKTFKKKKSNLAVYGEFGSLPIKEQNNKKSPKYYRRLVPVFRHMHALGVATWCSNVQVVVLIIELNDQDNIDL